MIHHELRQPLSPKRTLIALQLLRWAFFIVEVYQSSGVIDITADRYLDHTNHGE